MPDLISSIGTAFSVLNTLKSWAGELRNKAAETQNMQFENLALKIENKTLELERELREIAQENEDLRRQDDVRDKLVYRNGVYELTAPVPGVGPGPFCHLCWEQDQKLISLRKVSHNTGRNWLACDRCGKGTYAQ